MSRLTGHRLKAFFLQMLLVSENFTLAMACQTFVGFNYLARRGKILIPVWHDTCAALADHLVFEEGIMNRLKLGLAAAMLAPAAAHAQIVRVTEGNFLAAAGLITFSEFAVNTENPTYAPGD
jgi:hypothetical protein